MSPAQSGEPKKKQKILVVDDEEKNLLRVKEFEDFLKKHNEVLEAEVVAL